MFILDLWSFLCHNSITQIRRGDDYIRQGTRKETI